ncbi:hypothetical protein GF325_13060 [Candidatus Bathyarchaeota archaeon]|nr:hypothetical protein [Candidatus Bathyarchaeota archaeon]
MENKKECRICGYRFTPGKEGGSLAFAKREKDKLWREHAEDEELVGEKKPPEVGWFCAKHYPEAEKCTDMAINDAIELVEFRMEGKAAGNLNPRM